MCRLHGDSILGSPGSDLQAKGGVWAGRWAVLTQCSPAVNHKPLPPGRHGAPAQAKLPRPPGSPLTLSSSICPETASHPGSHRCQVHCLIPSVSSQGAPCRKLPQPPNPYSPGHTLSEPPHFTQGHTLHENGAGIMDSVCSTSSGPNLEPVTQTTEWGSALSLGWSL